MSMCIEYIYYEFIDNLTRRNL